ncbi:MAG: SMP-30/gluconolactonase/LRE family protein [Pseudomonadota bacterium]
MPTSRQRTAITVVAVIGSLLLLAIVLTLVSPVDSVAWEPPAAPELKGQYAQNERLLSAGLLAQGKVDGPEDIDVDSLGRVYGGLADGRIVRVLPDGTVEDFANTGGRPLGLEFDDGGNLIVADAFKGLLSVSTGGQITVLATEAEGVPFGFTDDVDIAADGIIYFSDASSKWPQTEYEQDLLESQPYGRLLAYDPRTKTTRVLLSGLHFANGVALSSVEDFVLVNETWRYRIVRYWLAGERAGQHEIFVDNLPGFPDGVSGNRQGTFWVALASPRKADLDAVHPFPRLKELMASLPKALRPRPERYGFVLGLDQNGNVVANLQDPTGDHLNMITSVEQADDWLYFGSLTGDRIGRMKVSEALAKK